MRFTLFVLMFCFYSVGIAAQNHLEFEGMPIDGTVSGFVRQLEKNYTQRYESEDHAAYVVAGNFHGYDNCEMFVLGEVRTGLIYSVVVNMPKMQDWDSLCVAYTNMKNYYTECMGEPSGDVMGFVEMPAERDKIMAINMGYGRYKAVWRSDHGEIRVEIKGTHEKKIQKMMQEDKPFAIPGNILKAYVEIIYVDKLNNSIYRAMNGFD